MTHPPNGSKWIPHCRIGFLNPYLETKPLAYFSAWKCSQSCTERKLETCCTQSPIQHASTVFSFYASNLQFSKLNNPISKSIGFSFSYHFSIIIINNHHGCTLILKSQGSSHFHREISWIIFIPLDSHQINCLAIKK